jgi:hypothetical protein
MTLHLTRISSGYTLQVSDRLVGGGVKDPLANKNIVYWARGGVVAIGYTGLAYELSSRDRNVPTDEWMAEVLWGKPFQRGHDGVRPVTFGSEKILKWLDVGQSIERLRSELQKSLDRLPLSRRKLPFEIVVAGWQETRRGLNPVLVQIVKPPGTTPCVIERPERQWHFRGRIALLTTPGGYLSDLELANLQNQIPVASPDESEALLVAGIRRVSLRSPDKVGPHCMSILLPPLGVSPIRIRFIPEVDHSAVFTTQNPIKERELPVAFSPWIVGPNMFCAPSITVGASQVQMGPVQIVIEAPMPEAGITGYMGALERPPGP